MSRKDFELIAGVIAHLPSECQLMDTHGIVGPCRDLVAERFASALAATNGRFDRGRFLRACGVVS